MLNRLLDSVVLIDHFNKIQKATNFIIKLDPTETAISVITRAEILAGIKENSTKKIKSFLDQYTVLPIDTIIADIAANQRREYGWKLPDAFQAALSLNYNIKLCTRNTKDFNPKKHLFVEVPYSI